MEMISFFTICLLTLLLFCAYVAVAQWRNTRDVATPWYIGYLLAADLHYFRQFWIDVARDHGYPYPPDLPLRWDSPLSYLSLICYILFMSKILDFQTEAPRLDRIFKGVAGFYIILLVLHIVIQFGWGYDVANQLYQSTRLLMFPVMIATVVFLRRHTIHFYQKLILLGCLFLIGGMLSAILTELFPWYDPLPDMIRVFSTPWGQFYFYHMKVGIFFDVICFSWAITLLQKYKYDQVMPNLAPISLDPQTRYLVGSLPENEAVPVIEDEFMTKVNDFLSQNYGDENMGVPDLAKAVFLSAGQTNRRIKDKTGLTTEQYIRYYRLERAHEMLLNTNKPIKAIAMDVGFKDLSHFSTCFKRQYRVSPSEVARNGGEKAV